MAQLVKDLCAMQETQVQPLGQEDPLEKGMANPVYETAKETLMYRTVLWTLWDRERVGRFGRMALKHVKYHV